MSYAGNVFRAGALLLEPFERALRERRPEPEVVAPEGDSLAGAALLAARDSRSCGPSAVSCGPAR